MAAGFHTTMAIRSGARLADGFRKHMDGLKRKAKPAAKRSSAKKSMASFLKRWPRGPRRGREYGPGGRFKTPTAYRNARARALRKFKGS